MPLRTASARCSRSKGIAPAVTYTECGDRVVSGLALACRDAGARLRPGTLHDAAEPRRECKHHLVTQAGDGIALSRSYFTDLVAPLLRDRVPEVRYAAARVGAGSDVLGLDDETSRDHDWGLRLQLFVSDASRARVASELEAHLPAEFGGYPVRFGFSGDPVERVRVDVTSVHAFIEQQVGFDPREGASALDWLSLSGQAALQVVGGTVFEDQIGDLTSLREALAWYPDDIWRYIVACDWQRLDQELPLVGRAGARGDELGSRVIAARLAGVAVHLAFVLSRSWPPYAKWRGSVLSRLSGCASIVADLERVFAADGWQDRQAALGDALTGLARLQRECGLPAPVAAVELFWDRPHLQVSRGLVLAVLDGIESAEIRALPVGVGSVEQQSDNVDILLDSHRRRRLAATLGSPD